MLLIIKTLQDATEMLSVPGVILLHGESCSLGNSIDLRPYLSLGCDPAGAIPGIPDESRGGVSAEVIREYTPSD